MHELTIDQMRALEGEGFWSGVGCGLGLAGSAYAVLSPDPFSKIALVTYGGTLAGCYSAFRTVVF